MVLCWWHSCHLKEASPPMGPSRASDNEEQSGGDTDDDDPAPPVICERKTDCNLHVSLGLYYSRETYFVNVPAESCEGTVY